jgi:hypothetical protein
MAFSRGTSENSILFFNGGHDHNGVSSSLINTNSYSIYDFVVGKIGDSARQNNQQKNYDNLKNVITNIVKTDILGPSGVRLGPNSVQSVNIAAGAVTAGELAANIVLVNNIISSGNFDGTVAANGVITSQGTSGWAITSAGSAVFDSTAIRGTLTASAVSTPGIDILSNGTLVGGGFTLYGNGAIVTSGGNFQVDASGNLTANNAIVTGTIYGSSGQIAGWTIDGNNLTAGGFPGYITIGPTAYSLTGEAGMQIAYDSYATNLISGTLMLEGEGNLIDLNTSSPTTVTISNGFSSTIIGATGINTNNIAVSDEAEMSTGSVNGVGIKYPGCTTGPGTPNYMGLVWDQPDIRGTVDNVVSAVLGTVSDERSKSYILDAEDVWLNNLYNSLRVVSFNPVDLLDKDNLHLYPRRLGLIAQEVRNVLPDLVVSANPYDEEAFLTVNYLGLVPYLIQAVQDLNNRVKELENEV